MLGDPGPTGVLMESIHVAGGPPTLLPLRSLVPVSLLGIAVGGGIGPEPALMQTTATISAWIGRRLRASPAELRVLTVTGLASGLTVLFAAPLGGAVTGVSPHLTLPDLMIGAFGGVAGAAVAHLFGFMIRTCGRISARLPSWARPVAAGLALGALGLAVPTGLTYGEAQLTALVTIPAVAVTSLLLAAIGHLASAAVTLAGDWKGGIIIPMFFVGYCLGRAMAEMSGHDGYYLVLATSMMVACNTGMTKTPLGSALVVAEMTAVTLVPPLVIAALVSLLLTSRVTFVGGQRHRDQPAPPPERPLPG
ncbi:MAG: chloride channel protein [Streptosporangiaceae bacterium]